MYSTEYCIKAHILPNCFYVSLLIAFDFEIKSIILINVLSANLLESKSYKSLIGIYLLFEI